MGGCGEWEERGVGPGDTSSGRVITRQELRCVGALQHDIPVSECRIQEANDHNTYRVSGLHFTNRAKLDHTVQSP